MQSPIKKWIRDTNRLFCKIKKKILIYTCKNLQPDSVMIKGTGTF